MKVADEDKDALLEGEIGMRPDYEGEVKRAIVRIRGSKQAMVYILGFNNCDSFLFFIIN